MNQRELLDVINVIRDKSENGSLVIFVGAGVSMNVEGMPSWYDLIKEMASTVGYSRCDYCKHKKPDCESSCSVRYDYDSDEFLKIPQYLFQTNEEKYYKILKEKLCAPTIDAPFSKLIFDLKPKHIVTTNYDHLLEQSTHPNREKYEVIIEDRDLCAPKKNNYIIKLHGDIDNLETIVLKEQDYLCFSNTHKWIESFFKIVLASSTILFVGYSLKDKDIVETIYWLNQIRSINGVVPGSPIGYAIFDEENVPTLKEVDFEKKNISFVNVHDMPLIDNIPNQIKADCGKRLYSFLSVISKPTLSKIFNLKDYLDNLNIRLGAVEFIPYDKLAKALDLKNIYRTGNVLITRTETDFNRVREICECGYPSGEKIRKLFINAGITNIEYQNQFNPIGEVKKFSLGRFNESGLFKEQLYECYLTNEYQKLLEISEIDSDLFKKAFYLHLIKFYNEEVFESYKQLGATELDAIQSLNYQYNKAMLDSISRWCYSLSGIKELIQKIPSEETKQALSLYEEVLERLDKKILYINTELKKLKNLYCDSNVVSLGWSLSSLYRIKDVAIEIYNFYFYNNLFIEKRGDIKEVLALYLEAILCTNGERERKEDPIWGYCSKDIYSLDIIDWDIITKFISVKNLMELIAEYKVKKISLNFENKGLIELFANLVRSVDCVLQTSRLSFWNTISNYFVLLNLVDFSDDEFSQIEEHICSLLSNKKFISFFFTINYPDFRSCLKPLVLLCKKAIKHNHVEIVQNIVVLNTFHDYFINSNHRALQNLFEVLLVDNENELVQKSLFDMIVAEGNDIYKDRLIWLFKNSIKTEDNIAILKKIITNNWERLDDDMFLDFVFANWVTLDSTKKRKIFEDVIKLDKQRNDTGVHYIPDPLEGRIAEVSILFLTGMIDSLAELSEIKNKTPQLEFLLSPDSFDYEKVDTTDYMWENIIRSEKYLPYFVKEKGKIEPKIKKRIEIGEASEFELKLLYGVFMDRSELFNL